MQNAKTFLEKSTTTISRRGCDSYGATDVEGGFEGQMTEKTIEIGVISDSFKKAQGNGDVGEPIPVFRKLSESEIKDYLAL